MKIAFKLPLRFSLLAALFIVFTSSLLALSSENLRERLSFDSDWRFSLGKLENPLLKSASPISDWEYLLLGASADKKYLSIPELGFIKKRVPCSDVFGEKAGFAWFRTRLALPRKLLAPLPPVASIRASLSLSGKRRT